MRNILKHHTAAVVDRVLVDAMSANAYVTVYDALGTKSRISMEALPVEKAVNIAWRLVR